MQFKRYKYIPISLLVLFMVCEFFSLEVFSAQKSNNETSRVLNATLWVEQVKVPITQGSVIFIDSLFGLFVPRRALTKADIHENIILQIQGDDKQANSLAKVVDYDLVNNWMLIEIKKKEILAPKQKLSAVSIVELAIKNRLIQDQEKIDLMAVLQKFENNNHKRGLAEQKSFSELIESQLATYADKLTETLIKSNRKMQWSENSALLLPGVDSCSKDYSFKEKMKSASTSSVLHSYRCRIERKVDRDITSAIKPEFEILAGTLSSSDSYLRVPNVVNQLNEASHHFEEKISNMLNSTVTCQSHWISERNIYAKSCIEKSENFKNLYNGAHYFGYYQNQKIIYQVLFLKDFTEQNHKDLAQKFLKGTKGGVL